MEKFIVGEKVRGSIATPRFGMEGVVTSILSEEDAKTTRELFRLNSRVDVGADMPAYNVRFDGAAQDIEMLELELEDLAGPPDPRNYLKALLWIGVPCDNCMSQPGRGILGVPFLKYSIYDVLSGQGVAVCPECNFEIQKGGFRNEIADRLLLKEFDDAWRQICDLIEDGGANLTKPPDSH